MYDNYAWTAESMHSNMVVEYVNIKILKWSFSDSYPVFRNSKCNVERNKSSRKMPEVKSNNKSKF